MNPTDRRSQLVRFFRQHAGILLTLTLFLILGIVYSVTVPIFEASDELNHYPFIQYVAQGHGLPVQRPGVETLWGQEGSQPPLYYLLGAALTRAIDTNDLPTIMYLNPHGERGVPLAPDNKNMIVHTDRERFPWQGTALAVHLVRLMSVLLGAGTVLCTYLLVLNVFPQRLYLANAAAAVNAFIPMFLFISGSVNNDNLVIFLSALSLLLLARAMADSAAPGIPNPSGNASGVEASRSTPCGSSGLTPTTREAEVSTNPGVEALAGYPADRGRRPFTRGSATFGIPAATWRLLALGVVIGLACLSKLSALGLVPLAALALAWPHLAALRRSNGASAGTQQAANRAPEFHVPEGYLRGHVLPWIAQCLAVCVPVVLIAGWWYLRNWQLYGDPTGLNTMLQIAGRRPAAPGLLSLIGEFEGFRLSFWGVLGGFNILLQPGWVYRLLDGLSLLALAGLIYGAWRTRRWRQSLPWPTLLILATWILVELVALVRWTSSTMASQGRLVFPALPAICLFFVLGLAIWLPAHYRPAALGILATGLCALAALTPFSAVLPSYPRPVVLTSADIPATAHRVNIDYGNMRLLAYEADRDKIRPGDWVNVTLYWQAQAPIDRDFSISLKLLSAHRTIAQHDTYPSGGTYPTRFWQSGQVVRDVHRLRVVSSARGPAPAWLIPGVYDLQTMAALPPRDQQGQVVEFPSLTTIRVTVPRPTLLPSQRVDANFRNQVSLIGYDMPREQTPNGDNLPLTLYWQVNKPLDGDYMVFLHLVDEHDQMAGQGDGQPMGGFYPSSRWKPGEILDDVHHIAPRQKLASGKYRVYAGLYDPKTGKRLPVLDPQGNPAAEEVQVATIDIP